MKKIEHTKFSQCFWSLDDFRLQKSGGAFVISLYLESLSSAKKRSAKAFSFAPFNGLITSTIKIQPDLPLKDQVCVCMCARDEHCPKYTVRPCLL